MLIPSSKWIFFLRRSNLFVSFLIPFFVSFCAKGGIYAGFRLKNITSLLLHESFFKIPNIKVRKSFTLLRKKTRALLRKKSIVFVICKMPLIFYFLISFSYFLIFLYKNAGQFSRHLFAGCFRTFHSFELELYFLNFIKSS